MVIVMHAIFALTLFAFASVNAVFGDKLDMMKLSTLKIVLASLENQESGLNLNMLMEQPASLKFATALHIAESNISIDKNQIPDELSELVNKIIMLLQSQNCCSIEEKILLMNLIYNSNMVSEIACEDRKKFLTGVLENGIELQNMSLINLSIMLGCDVNAQLNADGHTALMTAAKNGSIEILQVLLDNNANLEQKDAIGKTAFLWAVERGHREVAQMLLDYGADINTQNQYGNTALMWTARFGDTAMAKMLLNGGADINIRNIHGDSAVTIAARNKNEEIEDVIKYKSNSM